MENHERKKEKENVPRHELEWRPDYSKRHRKVEWRHRWFRLHRSENDDELLEIRIKALNLKQRKIKIQQTTANHMAAYGPAPASAGTPWVSIGPRNINGRVKSLAVVPTNENIVYAGAASGGVWKSEDGGQSWRPLWNEQESLVIASIAIALSDHNTIYVGTGEWTPGYSPSYPGSGVYVSNNAGATWTQRASVNARRIARILVSQDDYLRVYVAGESGFERSTDGGVTWTTVRAGQISDAVIDPHNADILYINVRNDGIYKSTDGGDNWTKLTTGPTGTDADWIRLAIGTNGTNSSNFVIAKRSGTLYRTTDGGTTWTTLAGSHGAVSFHQWANLIPSPPVMRISSLQVAAQRFREPRTVELLGRIWLVSMQITIGLFSLPQTLMLYMNVMMGVYIDLMTMVLPGKRLATVS